MSTRDHVHGNELARPKGDNPIRYMVANKNKKEIKKEEEERTETN